MTIIFEGKNKIIKISFVYKNNIDVFDEIDANKLFKHRFRNYTIEIKNKIFFFEFKYTLFIIELKILRKYLNDGLKQRFIVFFSTLTETFIMFVQKKRQFAIMRKL